MASDPSRWVLRVVTFALWAGAAGSAAYWGLRWAGASGARPGGVPIAPVAPALAAVDPLTVARALGAGDSPAAVAAPMALASRFALLGVVAGGPHRGAALIAVDGKPPRPFQVGAVVEAGLILQSVAGRSARLGTELGAPPQVQLEMPALSPVAAAATATNPSTVQAPPPQALSRPQGGSPPQLPQAMQAAPLVRSGPPMPVGGS